MKTFPPGSTIGILGGGQLGRMTALAAAKLGYRCHIFCADESEPAVAVAEKHTKALFTDHGALESFAKSIDVCTLEWENIPLESLDTVARFVPTYPGRDALAVAQDREQEKSYARQNDIGTADYVIVRSEAELAVALATLKGPAVLKSTRMGYDGKGQVNVSSSSDAKAVWPLMGGSVAILEDFIDFACEVSVIVAARADGATAAYPAVENIHRHHILAETHVPARIDVRASAAAEHAARKLAEKLKLVGLLAVEFFVLRQPNAHGKRVLLNELAPRPHNSGHWTMDGCPTSQFEQLIRAICGLPLGDTRPMYPSVMHNLIGHQADDWQKYLADPDARLHLYGKTETREGRKMGHVTFVKRT